MGTLLVPLGVPLRRVVVAARGPAGVDEPADDEPADDEPPDDVAAEMEALGEGDEPPDADAQPDSLAPLVLPFARRDLDRLRLILAAQRRLLDVRRPPGQRHQLQGRGYLEDALRWLDIHGGPDGRQIVSQWRGLQAATPGPPPEPGERHAARESATPEASPPEGVLAGARRGRRRRRRRRARPAPPPAA
jgi:hypothetical protein